MTTSIPSFVVRKKESTEKKPPTAAIILTVWKYCQPHNLQKLLEGSPKLLESLLVSSRLSFWLAWYVAAAVHFASWLNVARGDTSLGKTILLEAHPKESQWLKVDKSPTPNRAALILRPKMQVSTMQMKRVKVTKVNRVEHILQATTNPTLQWISPHLTRGIPRTQPAQREPNTESRLRTIRTQHHPCEHSDRKTNKYHYFDISIYKKNAQDRLRIHTEIYKDWYEQKIEIFMVLPEFVIPAIIQRTCIVILHFSSNNNVRMLKNGNEIRGRHENHPIKSFETSPRLKYLYVYLKILTSLS